MAVDKPTVNLTLAQLRKEVVKPDPYKIAISGSKIITFPDVNAMESAASDELAEKIENPKDLWGLLNDWLSPADAKALAAEKLTRSEIFHVIRAAAGYYREQYGDLGEGAASAN
jgi:hypothetical protein